MIKREVIIATRAMAMNAARAAISQGTSLQRAADAAGIAIDRINCAHVILKWGTPQEIEMVETGEWSLHLTARNIRQRTPAEFRAKARKAVEHTEKRPDREARARALAGARLVMDGMTQRDAARISGGERTGISSMITILTHGTEEMKAAAIAGKLKMRDTATAMRAHLPPPPRKWKLSEEGREVMSAEMEIWSKLKAALDAIQALPQPVDVLTIVKKNPQRRIAVERQLDKSFTWLTEFTNAWTK